MFESITGFFEDLFYDWTPTAVIVWIVLSAGSIYVSWFAKIPSAVGDSVGFPITVKYGVSILIPVITWYLITNKEWTAEKFRKRSK